MLISPIIQNITADPSDIVEEEDKLIIRCNADGYPEPRYSFKKVSLIFRKFEIYYQVLRVFEIAIY